MKTIAVRPFDYTFDPDRTAPIVIDMQRDFIEPGGFGAALGTYLTPPKRNVTMFGRLLGAFRGAPCPSFTRANIIGPIFPTAAAKRSRGSRLCELADGRVLISGEPGSDISRSSRQGERDLDKFGKDVSYTGFEAPRIPGMGLPRIEKLSL
jgi:biuret amidohydrolase